MTNCRWEDISHYNDINTLDQYQVALDAGCTPEEALECCYQHSRDNARTPMHWSAEKNAGFTSGTPWLELNPNYPEINVAQQQNRPDSVLSYYKKLIALRKAPEYVETFTYGEFVPAYETLPGVLAYLRKSDGQTILVAANYGTDAVTLPVDSIAQKVLLSNTDKEETVLSETQERQQFTLLPCESVVILL